MHFLSLDHSFFTDQQILFYDEVLLYKAGFTYVRVLFSPLKCVKAFKPFSQNAFMSVETQLIVNLIFNTFHISMKKVFSLNQGFQMKKKYYKNSH